MGITIKAWGLINLLKHPATFATGNSEIEQACSHFLEQARVLLPVGNLTVLMLDPLSGMGSVVFCWNNAADAMLHSNGDQVLSSVAGPEPHSVLNITMYGAEGAVGGVLLRCARLEGFSPLECRLARDLSAQLALRLDNAQLRRRLQNAEGEMALVHSLARIVASSPTMDELYERLLAALGTLVAFESANLSWISADRCQIHRLDSHDGPARFYCGGLSTPITYTGLMVGALELRRAGSPFKRPEKELVALVCQQIAPAVHHARFPRTSPGRTSSPPGSISALLNSADGNPTSHAEATADLAHSLYSPLTSIKGYTSALLDSASGWPPELQQEFLSTIYHSAERLNQAIRDLLAPPTGPAPAVNGKAPTAVAELLDSADAAPASNGASRRVSVRSQPGLPPVLVDPALIKRVIEHLIDCALSTVGPGAGLLVEASHAAEGPVISIGPAAQKRGPQEPELAATPGWDQDLRVVVCRHILEAHGTTLGLEVTPHGDTRFWFPLPAAPPSGNGGASHQAS